MQTWLKYALSFFALCLILAGFIYAFGPASARQAYQSGESPVGQLRADQHTVSPGEAPSSVSATTQSVPVTAPATAPNDVPQPAPKDADDVR